MGKKIGPIKSLFVDCPVSYVDANSGEGSFEGGDGVSGLPGPSDMLVTPVQYMNPKKGKKVTFAGSDSEMD